MISGIADTLNPLNAELELARPDALGRFSAVLDRKIEGPTFEPVELGEEQRVERDEEVYEAAEQLVASAFIAPLLAQLRDAAKQNNMFYGGSTEDLFGHQLDEQIADRVVKSSRFGLVDAVYREISGLPRGGDAAGRVNVRG
ncbi:MAG: rod-binding protein [Planctomycetota bacterium]